MMKQFIVGFAKTNVQETQWRVPVLHVNWEEEAIGESEWWLTRMIPKFGRTYWQNEIKALILMTRMQHLQPSSISLVA